jgi:hypothetical protein
MGIPLRGGGGGGLCLVSVPSLRVLYRSHRTAQMVAPSMKRTPKTIPAIAPAERELLCAPVSSGAVAAPGGAELLTKGGKIVCGLGDGE